MMFLAYIGVGFLNGMIEQTYLGSTEMGVLAVLMSPVLAIANDPIGGIFSSIATSPEYLDAIWSMFWFDYAQFHGEFGIFRLILIGFSVGIIISLTITILRGVSSS